ncbi:hypothetical protein, partial [Streptomyces otsuchiensis]|uniref:hypothetical protein n=1 Tax=Streptomyces otsuchiensis TaxID=2681388 RepID=UPI001D1316DA
PTPEQRLTEIRERRARNRAANPPDPLRPVSTHPLVAEIEQWSPAQRAAHAKDETWVGTAGRQLKTRHFAHVAAALMVTAPPGVHQPAAASRQARRVIADVLRSKEVAQRLLLSGTRVVIIPADQKLTDLPEFASLAGTKTHVGQDWDMVRGVESRNGVIAVGEENLLGTTTRFGANADGYSVLTHELAHSVHRVLTTRPSGRLEDGDPLDGAAAVIGAAHSAGVRLDDSPHGPARRQRSDGTWTQPNYAISNQEEFFAQLTNTWLGSNGGRDPFTGFPMRNDQQWVTQFAQRFTQTQVDGSETQQEIRRLETEQRLVQRLVPLLTELYGPKRTPDLGPHNPREAVRQENEVWDAFRSLWDGPNGPDPGLLQGTTP